MMCVCPVMNCQLVQGVFPALAHCALAWIDNLSEHAKLQCIIQYVVVCVEYRS